MFEKSVPQHPQLCFEIPVYLQRCTRLQLYSSKMFEVTFVHPCQSKQTNINTKMVVCSRNGVSIIFICTAPCHPCQARQLQLWFLTLSQGLGVRVWVYHPKNPQKHAAGLSLRCRVRPRCFNDLGVQPCHVFLLKRKWSHPGQEALHEWFHSYLCLCFPFRCCKSCFSI